MAFPRLAAALAFGSLGALGEPRCDHAAVGAGPAGVYHLWRLATATDAPRQTNLTTLCLFEQLRRAGGRVATRFAAGPRGDLVVEPGAYRFAPEKFCFTMHGQQLCIWTPLVAGIVRELGLRSENYNPDPAAFDHALHKIVDHDGNDAGFARFVLGMLAEIEARAAEGKVRFEAFYGHSLEAVAAEGRDSPLALRLQDRETGAAVDVRVARSLVLNLPQLPLLRVLDASSATAPAPPRQLHEPNPTDYMKLYLHYADAWWRGGRYGLDLTHGAFSNLNRTSRPSGGSAGDVFHFFPGVEAPAPLHGAYHDGDVRCEGAAAPGKLGKPGKRCRGFLQAVYTSDPFALMFYRSFALAPHGDRLDPLTIVNRTSHGAAGAWLLDEAHKALVELHAAALTPETAARVLHSRHTQPDQAVLALWDRAAEGFGAACHFSRVPLGASGSNATHDAALAVARHALRPFFPADERVFVASEAFAPLQCWSEGALQLAENALQRLGVGAPAWLPREAYAETIFTDAAAPASEEGEHSAGFARRHRMPAAMGVATYLI